MSTESARRGGGRADSEDCFARRRHGGAAVAVAILPRLPHVNRVQDEPERRRWCPETTSTLWGLELGKSVLLKTHPPTGIFSG